MKIDEKFFKKFKFFGIIIVFIMVLSLLISIIFIQKYQINEYKENIDIVLNNLSDLKANLDINWKTINNNIMNNFFKLKNNFDNITLINNNIEENTKKQLENIRYLEEISLDIVHINSMNKAVIKGIAKLLEISLEGDN